MTETPPLCPDCGQPGTLSLADTDPGWECRNEACPEFGQPLRADEGRPQQPPDPGDGAAGRVV
jgi:hypothetical protein